MDLLRNFKTSANFLTIIQNKVNVLFHCIEVTEKGLKVVEEAVGLRENVLANGGDDMIVGNSLAANVITDMLEFGILNQLQIRRLDLKAIIHIANEVHEFLISMTKCIWNLIKDNIFAHCRFHLVLNYHAWAT